MKPSSRFCIISLAAIAAMTLSGCGGQSHWEITVENKGTTPCSVYVTMDYASGGAQGAGEAKVEKMAAGDKLTLIAGEVVQTIRSVQVVRGEFEQELKPNAELRPGLRYQIVVAADNKVEASFSDGK